MKRRILYISSLLLFMLSLLLSMVAIAATASPRLSSAALHPAAIGNFPVVDPVYIYNQQAYLTSNFQQRQAGFVSGQGHDRFAAYWSQEMARNLAGFGPQVRQDSFPVHGWRDRLATLPAFNMEVSVPGLSHPEQEVVIGCHYDGEVNSTQSAFDDTSGCAYELGVGKALGDYWRSHHVYPARVLRFIIFDAEEQGLFGSFHYLNSAINGDLPNVTAMFNEEQSGINYPARFLGRAANPFMPDYINVTPLQDNAAYPGRIHLTPAQRANVLRFRSLWQQAIPAVFAQFQAVGYTSLTYYNSSNQNVSLPIFSADQVNNLTIRDDPSSNSDQVPFIYAGLPVAMVTGDQSYYDSNPQPWAYPYDLPVDTLQLMDTYASGTERPSAALALAMALPAMLTAWMLTQPDVGGVATADGNPIAAISDVGQTVVGQNLALDARASYDPANANSPLSYAWSFGDGASASGVSVNHIYHAAGSYTLTLTVTSPTGKRRVSKLLSVGYSPNNYSNPYSPLGGINATNPAVSIAQANNNLPMQPALLPPKLPLPTSTSTPTPGITHTATVAAITPTHPAMQPPGTTSTSSDTLRYALYISIGILIAVIGFVALLFLGRRLRRRT